MSGCPHAPAPTTENEVEAIPFLQLPPMAPLDPYQEQRLRRRLAALELGRSTSRALILDSDEYGVPRDFLLDASGDVLDPREVRRSRFGGGPMSTYESALPEPVE